MLNFLKDCLKSNGDGQGIFQLVGYQALQIDFCVLQSTRKDSGNCLPIMFPKIWMANDYELLHDNALLLLSPSHLTPCNF
jgi:hypothetical protein